MMTTRLCTRPRFRVLLAVLGIMLAAGAMVDAMNRAALTPLVRAVWAGHHEMAAKLQAAGALPSVVHPESGRTPLPMASVRGCGALATALLASGASAHVRAF